MANTQQSETIGSFVVERVLGRGAQGVVYLARDNRLNRFVAIKTIAPNKARKNIKVAQFKKEASALAKLKHTNIVPLYDIGDWDGSPYLVFEYVEGETLAQTIGKRDQYSIPDALKIAIGVLNGLSHAHQQGIIHCDIKPSNVLMDHECNPRISDFGISRLLCDSVSEKSEVQGSLQYLSPEMLNEKPVSPQSDIFSFGLLLFELLTGTSSDKCIGARRCAL